ncbi:ABC transporter permease [Algoriphagus sp. C2-6-M1]|uniref:ABC transporter permease n=1 Tax=Algoriphagus persicinus TaxID=3108754 RepID=UPI002B3AD1F9|nr:ABC transporter permease [Algoriphagus sp. C2-6-M1]MEB2782376.1 ABC transporter permease [Algoriphagus sp. C2-6-M1]
MLYHYLKIATRNLWRNKVFSLINILGLSIGMAACLLIFRYVNFELSYDEFRKPTLYRVTSSAFLNGEMVENRAQTAPAIAPAMQRDIPEVIQAARVVHTAPLMSDPVIQVGDRSFHEERIYYGDSSFLEMFSYRMVQGNSGNALSKPGYVVLSESMAEKYFPDLDRILGQSITFFMGDRGQTQLEVSGIFEDIPHNSHLKTDFIISFNSIPWNLDENWDWGNFYNYVEVLSESDPEVVRSKLYDILEKYKGETLAEWRKEGYYQEFDLQPIQQIHLDSNLEAEAEVNGSRRTVSFLTLIAVFILIIAWINYLNLMTAKAIERAKEIGIRKVVGSNRAQLIFQFMSESFLVNLIAAVLAIVVSQLLMTPFQALTLGYFAPVFDAELGIGILGLFLLGTFFSGIYPAVALSYQPVQMIKRSLPNFRNGVLLRKGLVAFQFATSIALIAGTLGVREQLVFMQQQDIGMNIDQVLIVKGPGIKDSTYQNQLNFFKSEVQKLPMVQEVSVSSNIPGQQLGWGRAFYQPAEPETRKNVNIIAVDEDFFGLYDTDFLAGRSFSHEFSSDRGAVIFNETAIRQLGFNSPEEAVQQSVIWDEADNDQHSKEILGVIRDFNQESLHKKVGPIVFALKEYLNAPWAGEYYSLKITAADYPKTLKQIQSSWEKAFSGSPFEYFFLDDYFNSQYQSDRQFAKVFSLFASLAILIACLGLFGLSSYMTIQRTKEIGIRKVLGATVFTVVSMLSKDFLKLVGFVSIIILPVIYFFMQKWLQNFAYQMEISWWMLILPVVLVWFMALVTVSFQSIKAALMNPVKSLKSE